MEHRQQPLALLSVFWRLVLHEKFQCVLRHAHALFLEHGKCFEKAAKLLLLCRNQVVVQGDGKHSEHGLGCFLRVLAAYDALVHALTENVSQYGL